MTEEQFNHLVVRRMKEDGLRQAAVAEAVNLTHDQFRVKLNRNRFTREEVLALKRHLKLSQSSKELERMLGGQKFAIARRRTDVNPIADDLLQIIAKADRESRRMSNQSHKIEPLYEHASSQMDKQCLTAVISESVIPIEMEQQDLGIKWRIATAKAVEAGATFLYVRPSEARLKYNRDLWTFARVLTMEDAENEIKMFRRAIVDIILADKPNHKDDEEAIKRTVEERVIQVYIERCAYFVPGFSFGLFHVTDQHSQALQRMTIRLPDNRGFLWMDSSVQVFRLLQTIRKIMEVTIRVTMNEKTEDDAKFGEIDLNGPVKTVRHIIDLLREYHGIGRLAQT